STAASTMFSNAPNQQPFAPTPSQALQLFGSQPLQPVMGLTPSQALHPLAFQPSQPLRSSTQTLQPFAPVAMPNQGQGPNGWQTMGGYPGGPSPFVQGPPGQGPQQGQGKAKKKRRFPIWARVIVGILLVLLTVGGAGAYYYEVNFAAPLSNITGQTVNRVHGDDAPSQGRDSNNSNGILSGGRINILLLGSDDDY